MYLGTVLNKNGEMEEIRERAVKGRRVIGSLAREEYSNLSIIRHKAAKGTPDNAKRQIMGQGR